MRNAKNIFQELVSTLRGDSVDEINAIAWLLVEHYLKLSKADVLAGKSISASPETIALLEKAVQRINRGEPVQYVLGVEYFLGREFQVNPSVLIPRPETEDLVRTVLMHARSLKKEDGQPLRLIDIGTGSGCIPVTLALQLDDAEVFATDVSTAALSVAVHNANVHEVSITLIEHDILKEDLPVGDLDIIVSNPPYVTEEEKATMKVNVLEHEPHQALFVPDQDPLLFYRHIADRGLGALKPGGFLAVEINERFGEEVADLFRTSYEDVRVVRDAAGKNRVVTAKTSRLPLT